MAATTETTTGTQDHGGGGGAFPPFNPETFAPQLVWLALTFGALYYIMSRKALPRIADVLEERANRIKRDLDAADRLRTETDKALASYEQALSDAKGNAGAIARDMRTKVTADSEREKASSEAAMTAKLQQAEASIAATKTAAMANVNDIAASTAAAIVSRLVGHEATKDEIDRALSPKAGA